MLGNGSEKLSRRMLLGGLAASTLIVQNRPAKGQTATPSATPELSSRPEPVELGEGFSILDWRVHPGDNEPRLIVEIHNGTDQVVTTPTVSFAMKDDREGIGAAWAVPWEPVIHPQSSTMLVSSVQDAFTAQEIVDTIDGWQLCQVPQKPDPEIVDALSTVTFVDTSWEYWTAGRHYWTSAINTSASVHPARVVYALVRDTDGRIAGGVVSSRILLTNSEPQAIHIWIDRDNLSPLNATLLLTDPFEMDVEFRVNAMANSIAPGCPAVMPWNR